MKYLTGLFLLLSLAANAVEITPTVRVNQSLSFADDLNFQNLDLAIDRQISSYDRIGLAGSIKFGTLTYPRSVLKSSLLLLKKLAAEAVECSKTLSLEECNGIFNLALNSQFNIYRPIPSKSVTGTHFTSYYSPDMIGSRVRTERFKNPLYRMPEVTTDQNYTRSDIDFGGALAGKGYEIFWVEDSLYDIYLLQVQGGGRINIHNADGTVEQKYLSYNGKNNRSFAMIYKYMLAKGYLKPGQAGIPQQRAFLEANPDKAEEIFNSCPSYVYFKESSEEPHGLNNIPLTEKRSLAIDSRIYKSMGMINFVRTVRPSHIGVNGAVVKVPFSRFFISQDTGGAIRGNARCDLYSGYGHEAELIAYNTNEIGEQYFLIKK
jgi:membrane-bound lytic murein transglycosylase A